MLETRRDEGFGDLLDSITPLELIREISFGIREERPRSVSLAEARKIVAAEKGIAEKDVIDNAETSAQIKERQINFLRFIRGESAASSEDRVPKVLAVSHGGFIRRFLANHCDRNIEKIRNCSVTIINVHWPAAGDDEVLCECREGEVDRWDHLSVVEGEQQPQDVYSFPSLRL
jgi:broad specificity phosphatase PhoE